MSNIKQVTMFTGIVRPFSAKKGEKREPDTNGKLPVVIEPIGGESPRGINVMSGTVAENQGLEEGKNYIFKAVHVGKVESSANAGQMIEGFNLSSLGQLSPMEAIEWYDKKGLKFQIDPAEEDSATFNANSPVDETEEEEEEKEMPST